MSDTLPPNKLAYRIDEAADALGLSRSTIYELANRGELEIGKLAGRSVILAENLKAYRDRAYEAPTRAPGTERPSQAA